MNYYKDQLAKLGEPQISVKFYSEQGSTNHMNLNSESIQAIREFLDAYENNYIF